MRGQTCSFARRAHNKACDCQKLAFKDAAVLLVVHLLANIWNSDYNKKVASFSNCIYFLFVFPILSYQLVSAQRDAIFGVSKLEKALRLQALGWL